MRETLIQSRDPIISYENADATVQMKRPNSIHVLPTSTPVLNTFTPMANQDALIESSEADVRRD